MIGFEDLVLEAVGRAKDLVNFLDAFETRTAGFDGKDVFLRACFGKKWPRRDEAGDVVHLGPVEDSGNVVIDAVLQAEDTITERVQISADQGGANSGFERRRE